MSRDFTRLNRAFNPKRVVVVGDKGDSGFPWLRTERTFTGELLSVQTNPERAAAIEAMGVKNYLSIRDIPGPVDLVIVSTPRSVAAAVLDDCIAKDVGAATFFTSGFAETATEEGARLERVLVEKARAADFNVIGPNCMGIFNPRLGVRQDDVQYTGCAGPVGFISQSGTHAIAFSAEAHLHGVDINKSVSFGNGTVLDSADYLEYFGQDPEIRFIGMYLEGVRNGKRFLSVLREVAARKPVVVWKGGQTAGGARAIASHTGSLAVPQAVWDAAVRQCGAITVGNQEEMIDTLNALIYLPPVRGKRVGLVGGSGGLSVVIADAFMNAGLEVPRLSKQSSDELATFFNVTGGGYGNPIDPGSNRPQMGRVLDILERDANIDNLVLLSSTQFWKHKADSRSDFVNSVINVKGKTAKPVMCILLGYSSQESLGLRQEAAQKMMEAGIPTFPSLERGARALANVYRFCQGRD